MKQYIYNLRKVSDELLEERKRSCHGNHPAWEPLETQIQRWWANLPPEMQQRKFQIIEIASQCSGKYRDSPALRQVAAALRGMDWTELRNWTKKGRNCRFWIPPHPRSN